MCFRFVFAIFFFHCFSLFSQCPAGQFPLLVEINPDNYPNETTWNLYVNNLLTYSGSTNGISACEDSSSCMRFEIYDSYGDGICCGYGTGSYNVIWNGLNVASGGEFQFQATHSFNCAPGTICESPIVASEGINSSPLEEAYFIFTPDSTGNYKFSTCNQTACDTKLWLYDDCINVDINSSSGALYYSDNDCALQSEISAFLIQGNTYILRIESSCAQNTPFLINFESQLSSVLPIVKLTTLGPAINNDIKVPVHMEIIDNGFGELNYFNQSDFAYEGDILTEWQGFSGPSYPKKNYDFDLIDANGEKIDTTLLGLPAENDWIFKAEYLDNSLLINSFVYEFSRRMGNYAPRTRQCEIFLDGNYIGVYTLTEKVKRNKNRVDIAKLKKTDTTGIELTGGYIIEMNINGNPGSWNSIYPPINAATCGYPVEFKFVYPKKDSITVQQENYIKSYVDSFEFVLNGPNYMDSTNGYRKFIDVSTFIDFLIVNEFSMNYDSYGRSTYMYKEKETDGGKLCIGPAWDYDRAMDNSANSGWVWENTHPYWPFPFWWSKFYTDERFKHELACRWLSLRQEEFKTSEFHNFIDSLSNLLQQGPANRNFAIWQSLGGQTYEQKVQSLKLLLSDRLDWMDQNLSGFGEEIPLIELPEDTIVCANTLFSVEESPNYSYNWIPGPESATIVFPQSGAYNLSVSDEFGCTSNNSINVLIDDINANFTMESDETYRFVFTGQNGVNSQYTWDFGDQTALGSGISVEHAYALSGAYAVELKVTDSLNCTQSSTQFLFNESDQINLICFPNPTQDQVIITHNLPQNQAYVFALIDSNGKKIKEWVNPNSGSIISLKNQAGGIYYVVCYIQDKKAAVKLLKE